MSSNSGFLDEQGMVDLARKAIEVLRQQGASPTEIRRLEVLLKDGNVGEAFIMSSLLRTILGEISPEAFQKKLLLVYRGLEDICQSLVELSRNLFDMMRGSIIGTLDTILLSHTVSKHWEFLLRRFKD